MPDPIDGPRTLDTLADGVAAAVHGADLDEGLGSLARRRRCGARRARARMVSLQDPDRPDPELTLTIGLDEAAQAGGRRGGRRSGPPADDRRPRPGRGPVRRRRSRCR